MNVQRRRFICTAGAAAALAALPCVAPAETYPSRAGTLRPLAVTTATRAEVLPNLPTVSDFVPGYESSLVDGIGAPKNTPLEIIEKLNREINAGLAPPKLRQHLADFGGTVLPGSPADYRRLIVAETNKWAKVIKFAGLKAS